MACGEFEVSGLLYVSGELDAAGAAAWEAHVAGCAECRREAEEYRAERASLYTEEVLGCYPSEAVDSEILRVCANPKKMLAGASLTPMMFIKKYASVPVFLMLVMVAVGGYVRYHAMNAEGLKERLVNETAAAAQEEPPALTPAPPLEAAAGGEGLAMSDSLNDGSNDSGSAAQKGAGAGGNLKMGGVFTVSGAEQNK